ncbi:alpha-(1-_3)-arabinofuranosyltransferase domain-containing protein [Nocardioides rubriscoriae]|uniref:alpha-(1->3)-arabinofuranosyltransferase domain-containing protein n=1 Tax=Nocardioides rubriscoriae TaxID=642762 RepID=UPI0011DFA29F|nr:alpha-(1->3)-arabinofuranosyltransferase family protein [Nocardioides rubriscoriae]
MGGRRATATPQQAPHQAPQQAPRGSRGAAGAAAGLYLLFVLMSLLQSPGTTTYDTRAELTQRPADFLASAFTLWHPESNFGEFQNQAYGYLFPQGSWFVLGDLVGLPDWVSQRLWSALVLVVAVEGARRVAGAVGLAPAYALLAGVVYGFAPRLLGTVSVITGETLPGAVMPWVVLPVVLALGGRMVPWRAALLSGAAVVCMGGVNAVENAGSLPLAAILVGWGAWRHLVSWRFAAGWAAAVGVASTWWALPLLVLAGYSPPFYEYVESAADTTALVGWSEASRGASHWVAYLVVGGQQWWPAANDLVSEPQLVLVSALVAGIGVVGLAHLRHVLRGPLVLAVLVGLGSLTIAHGGWEGSPVAGSVRALLDGPLQIFRNVHKIDPTVRLPLAIGFGHAVALAVAALLARRPSWTPSTPLLVMVPLAVVLTLGQPYLVNNARTPGWDEVADPWVQARDYLAAHQDGRTTLVLPGSGFAEQTWGWTLDEPLLVLGGADLVTRSQVPIVPGQSLRFLAALDQLASTGRASNGLGEQLARAGIGHVVVRRDLDRTTTGSPHPAGATVSLATAGLSPVASWGDDREGGPEVAVYEVGEALPTLRATPVDEVVTVRGAPESVLALQDEGLADGTRATVLEGEPGWDAPADVVTDGDQRRERAFGSGDESVSAVLGADDDWRVERSVHDYPTVSGATQVTARYDGLAGLTASSSQAYADNFGPVVLQAAPYFAVDGDPRTRWVTSSSTDPRDQWLRLALARPRPVRQVTVLPVADDAALLPIRSLEVRAGDQTRTVETSPSGAPVTARFDGRLVDAVEVRVDDVGTAGDRGRIGLREVTVDGRSATRTLLVPGTVAPAGSWVFTTTAERRACVAATQGDVAGALPDCDVSRIRGNEEPDGLDRTFTTTGTGTWSLRGQVIARSTRETGRLLEPLTTRQVGATSVYGADPRVATRFVYDGNPDTGWVSADEDRSPTLFVRFAKRRTVSGLQVEPGPGAPSSAVVRSETQVREVDLSGAGDRGAMVRFPALSGRRFEVTFVKADGSPRVAVRELSLRGAPLARAFDAATPTGAVCGLGPPVVVDGRRVPTRVVGTMADVVQGSPLRLEGCDDLVLAAGEHRLTVPPTVEFQAVAVAGLTTSPPRAPSEAPRDLDVTRWSASRRTVEVGGGAATLLHLPENFNPGWVAEADGRPLQALRVDGWQQGWVLPAGGATTVELTYRPQDVYRVLLPLGLGVSGALLLAGVVLLLLTALAAVRRRTSPDLSWPPARHRPLPRWGYPALAGLATLLLGPVAAVGLVASAALRARFTPVAVAAGALVVVAAGIDVLGGAAWWWAFGDAAAALGVGLLAGLALVPPPPWADVATPAPAPAPAHAPGAAS